MTKLFVAVFAVVIAVSSALAADPITTRHLIVATSTSAAAVSPGGRISLVVEVTPKQNMHVYAPGQPDVIPISLTLAAGEAAAAQAVQFPQPEKREFKELGETHLVYSKPFRLVQDVTVPSTPTIAKRAGSANGSVTVKGALKYQACDDTICYAPVTVPLTWKVALQASASPDPKKSR
jgi:DsbC/DsbD-like thiol-disulfide interchange protein